MSTVHSLSRAGFKVYQHAITEKKLISFMPVLRQNPTSSVRKKNEIDAGQ